MTAKRLGPFLTLRRAPAATHSLFSAMAGSVWAAGARSFQAIAVAGNGPDPVTPCGACRQVLREFPSGAELEVLCAGEAGDALLTTTLGDLLPESFGPEDLAGSGP